MTIVDRNLVLKFGLWLVLMEGWAEPTSGAARLDVALESVGEAAVWLQNHGYVEVAHTPSGARVQWLIHRSFNSLWTELIPERPCPVKLDRLRASAT